MEQYVYCINEENHGMIGVWTDEALARAEVDRLSENYENIDANDYWCHGTFYGNDMVQYHRLKANVPWC